jgi:hypothetical protein
MKNPFKTWWSKLTGIEQFMWTLFGFPILAAALFMFSVLIYFAVYTVPDYQSKQFQAWEKLTGNPNKLTLEEFIHLPKRYK